MHLQHNKMSTHAFALLFCLLLLNFSPAKSSAHPFHCQGSFKQGGLFFCQGKPQQLFYLTDHPSLPKPLKDNTQYTLEQKDILPILVEKPPLIPVRANQNGLAIFGLHRNAQPYVFILSPQKQIPQKNWQKNTRLSVQNYTVKQRQYKIENVSGLPPQTVTPKTEKQWTKIKQDQKRKQKAFKSQNKNDDFLKGFLPPAQGRISGIYGSQRILNGKAGTPHYGIDYAAPKGTPVFAPAPGLVTLAENNMYYEGGLVFINHGQGLTSAFLHMQNINVKTGDRVKTHQKIGEISNTGRASGPHLDWRVKWKKRQIDPEILLEISPLLQKQHPKMLKQKKQ